MFPERGEALNRTIECEAAMADLYATALNSWVLTAQPVVLPVLTAATPLPPEPDNTEETTGAWDQFAVALILAGLSSLWALSLVETMMGLELPLPEINLGGRKIELNSTVTGAITRTSEVTGNFIRESVERVESVDALRQARDDYLEVARENVAIAPTLMRDKAVAAMRDARPPAEAAPEPATDPMVLAQRAAVAEVFTPGSEAVRDVSRYQGYQAASVQNAAVVTAAHQSEDVLEKTWIATIDGKTRHTHFAADGQRTPLAGTFTVGNAQLRYPADPLGPAAEVRNCRCRVGILAPDEEIPDEVDRHTERLDGRDSVAVNRQGTQQDEIERRERQGTIRARDDEDGLGRTASGAPSDQEYDMPNPVTTTAEGIALATDDADGEASGSETFRTFTDQPIAFVGIQTSDGRMLQTGIDLSVRTPPLPMMWTKQTGYGHEDAFTVGVIESAKVDGDRVLGSGYWLNTSEADEAFNEASHKVSRPSVDLAATEWILTDEDGKEITEEDWWDLPMDATVIQTITAAELIGTTMVATPAFGDTMIEFNPERESRDVAVVASAAESFKPRVYAAALFAQPNLTEPTDIQMDPETGRIFGHLACFGQCHRSLQAQCVIAPRSPSQYGQFHTSPAVRLDDGSRLAVGRLTVGTGHAPDSLMGAPAKAHYDNTGACFALVRAYETSIGVEISGVVAPWATAEQVEMGLAAPLSGDWRDFGQGLDLIAALAVNTPGFAVRGRDGADGRPAALVASLAPVPTNRRGAASAPLTADAIADIVKRSITEANAEARTAMEAEALIEEATQLVGPPPAPLTPNEEAAQLLGLDA